MLVYSGDKLEFLENVKQNRIEGIILSEFRRKLFKAPAPNEVLSWKNSLQYMFNVLVEETIPADAGVSIEYVLPLSSKRIDFILTGKNPDHQDTAVIIELKQWSEVKKTTKDGIVKTYLGGSEREVSHPSYQAWSYAALIEDYNETVREEAIALEPCAYLHNLHDAGEINDPVYQPHLDKAPTFLASDAAKLQDFIARHVRYGDHNDIMYRIENGKIRPSKVLADSLVSMLRGNQEFVMIDDQKLVYETALDLAHRAQARTKQVLVVEGGPGTGKSVVAINLLVELTKRGLLAQYVSKNAAPRSVFAAKLSGSITKKRINNLFRGAGVFVDAEPGLFDVLIVDEAHRLNQKSGLFSNLGENQVMEIIRASKFSIFFLDEDQRIAFNDIGAFDEIASWAKKFGAQVHRASLSSQFRCNGSDGYLAWLDSALQLRETANPTLEGVDYDIRVFDSPITLREKIFQENFKANKARMVAGYCWKWVSKKAPDATDIRIEEFGFEAQWNLSKDGSLWIISPDSVREVGCIHTCQGLEVDYIGVIIGPDFIVRDGKVITDATKRDGRDKTIQGFKKRYAEDPEAAQAHADRIIKNTYRTLMTRGQKGCYLFCTDKETREYFTALLSRSETGFSSPTEERYPGLDLEILPEAQVLPYENAVPVFDLKAAAGDFSAYQAAGEFDWVALPEHIRATPGSFVVQVLGESMNKRIPNGAWCLFRPPPAGSRDGKLVLVQHRDIQDPEQGGQYTVKQYRSEKRESEGDGWQHARILLRPMTNAFGFKDIVLEADNASELRVVGEFVTILSYAG
jgi:DUF2075 family protein